MRTGVRVTERRALQQRIQTLAGQQVRRREEVRKAKVAMDEHLARRDREIQNLQARLANLPVMAGLKVAQ